MKTARLLLINGLLVISVFLCSINQATVRADDRAPESEAGNPVSPNQPITDKGVDTMQTTSGKNTDTKTGSTELATLAGGCFWCLEAIFAELKGVISVASGYSGGFTKNPTYKEVCSGTTGHAEVVQITFDPGIIAYRDLLTVFFAIHDPTTLNQQGADIGAQYRSAIFYHTPEQKKIAEGVLTELTKSKTWDDPIVTELTEFKVFYKAEAYHQDYFTQNPNQSYCRFVIDPKVEKFRKQFADKLDRKN